MKFATWPLFLIFWFSSYGQAREVTYYLRSPQGLLMGDAYTALAEDNYSLFYNPAILGRHKGLSLNGLNVRLQGTNPQGELDRFEDFPDDDPVAITDRLIGFPVHLDFGTAPGLKLGTFGFNLFANSRTDIGINNPIHPRLDMDYRYDRGFALGLAVPFSHGGRIRRRRPNQFRGFGSGIHTSVGVGAKYIKRDSLDINHPVFSTTILNEILSGNADDYTQVRENLGYTQGQAWSFDIGVDQTINNGPSQLSWGLAMTDVGETHFNRSSGNDKIPIQNSYLSMAMAFRQEFGLFGHALSIELRPLNRDLPFGRKLHLGAKLDFPVVDLLAGMSEGYLSYGLKVDLFAFNLTVGKYGVELGAQSREIEAERVVVLLNLMEFSFDGL